MVGVGRMGGKINHLSEKPLIRPLATSQSISHSVSDTEVPSQALRWLVAGVHIFDV